MHGISVIHLLCHYIHAVHQHIVINEIIQRTCLISTQSVGTYFVLKKYKIREKGVNCKRAFLSTHMCFNTPNKCSTESTAFVYVAICFEPTRKKYLSNVGISGLS